MEHTMHSDNVLLVWHLWTVSAAWMTQQHLIEWEASPHTVGLA